MNINPKAAGLSPARLATLDRFIQTRYVDEGKIAGALTVIARRGDYSWGGAASTYFWIDPEEDLITIFMAQLLPSTTYPIRRELRTLVYSAFTESNS